MSQIHPSALIDSAAEIDPTVEIGPFVVIEGPVKIGPRTKVMAHAHLSGRTTIGADNVIHMGAVLGHVPQHLAYKGGDSGLCIGDGNVFREYVTVHRAYHPGSDTIIGNRNFLMGLSHVGHDCRIGDQIIMANGALLAGHVQVEDMANISGNVAVHQYVRIGTLALLGGLSRVPKDVPPFMMLEGNGDIQGLNTVGLRRAGYDLPTRALVKRAYRLLYRSGLNVPQAVQQIESDVELIAAAPVRRLVDFIRASVRGISRHSPIRAGTAETAGAVEE